MSQLLDTSITILLCRHFYKWYSSLEQRASFLYQNSQIYMLIEQFWKKIKACLKYSFLGRITETKQAPPMVLDNSRTVRYLINSYERWKDKIIRYSKASSTVNLTEDIGEQLIFSPVKTISIVVVTAILVNAVLSVILQKQMGLWDFFIRVLFLFAGAAGLSCQAGWPTVKKSSIFLRKMWMD